MVTRIITGFVAITGERCAVKSTSAPTSLDVARRAGVSRSIVSGVLNGSLSTMRVSADTRERILAAAAELGYTPNPAARALRHQRSNVLGFVPRADRVTPYDSPVPFFLTVQLARAGIQRGYHVLEASTESISRHGTDDLVKFLLARHVDGVVLDSPESAEEVARLVDRRIPVVQMIRPQEVIRTPTVSVDAAPGTHDAISHLIDLGHRRIGFIGTGGQHRVDRTRLDTYLQVLRAHQIHPQEDWVELVSTYNPTQGATAAQRMFASSNRPTALFIAGDNLALGALQHFYALGIRIPDDLSVISYDDIFAAHLIPPLTSVHQPLEEAAERAIDLLIGRIERTDLSLADLDTLLPTQLVHRGSVGTPV